MRLVNAGTVERERERERERESYTLVNKSAVVFDNTKLKNKIEDSFEKVYRHFFKAIFCVF